MLKLYPAIQPYAEHSLQVDDTHSLYVEECGNPHGIPVLFLHGGPGVGCNPDSRRFFNPKYYRIILFDQRGSGRSKPYASLVNNTTQDLIADIEKIREHCKVDCWMLFGGSWGSTLAIMYAQTYPKQVRGMVLRGIFLARQEDLDWFYKDGASRVFPDHWAKFASQVSAYKRDNLIQAYYELLTGADELECMAAAKAWARWEAVCATLDPNPHLEKQFIHPHIALSMSKIETHYFVNNIFMQDNSILHNMDQIAHIPAIIVHGRYDMVCPLDNAHKLHSAWAASKLHIIRDAGHAACEPGIVSALVAATNDLVIV